MKQSTLFFFAIIFGLTLNAQKLAIKPGQIQLNAGIGLISTYTADKTTSVVPPVSVSAEIFVSPNIALGVYGAHTQVLGESTFQNADIIEKYDNKTSQFALKGTYYSNDMNGWRIYGGMLTGVSKTEVDKTSSPIKGDVMDDDAPSFTRPNSPNSFLFSGFVGTQRKVNQNLSLYGEIGFGISLVNVGVSYKL